MAVNVNIQRFEFEERAQGWLPLLVTLLVVLAVGLLSWYETDYVTDDKLPDTVVAILTKMGTLAVVLVWLYYTSSGTIGMFVLAPFKRGVAHSDGLWRAWHKEFANAQAEGLEPPAPPPEPSQNISRGVVDAIWRRMMPYRAGLDKGHAEEDAHWREWYEKTKVEVGELPAPPPVPNQRYGLTDS